ncbi:MAG: inner membrane protein YpjD, partial [Burkholderiales bacterium]
MPDIVIHAATAAAYAGLAWHFWRTRWRAQPAGTSAPSGTRPWERAALLAPLALHAFLLYSELFAPSELRFGFAQALSTMLWLAVLIYWFESLFYSLEGMQPPVLALAALAAPLPAIFPGRTSGALAASLEFKVHLV